jgi:hypothetical protein
MRKRYVSSRKTLTYDYNAESVHLVATTVFELEPMSWDTGLLDEVGNPIRYEEIRDPIGFIWHE